MQIKATYCTNYNGAHVDVDGVYQTDDKSDECVSEIVDTLVDKCDGDGEYCGSDTYATNVITSIVKNYYGEDTTVTVEFDHLST